MDGMRRWRLLAKFPVADAHAVGTDKQRLQCGRHGHRQRDGMLDGHLAGPAPRFARPGRLRPGLLFRDDHRVEGHPHRGALPGRPVGSVRIFFGTGAEVTARSFAAYPGFHEGDPTALDVGVVLMTDDLGRAAVPLLLSRDARVGETAVIAGWGKDQNQLAATLRAGSTTISAIGGTQLQTVASTNGSAVCSGDSGGPLLLLEGGVWSIAGITSAVTSTACTFGTNFFANVRNPSITSFILSQVPDAARR